MNPRSCRLMTTFVLAAVSWARRGRFVRLERARTDEQQARWVGAAAFVTYLLLATTPTSALPADAPVPRVENTAGIGLAFVFVERRGDYHLRHYGVPSGGGAITDDGAYGATGSSDGTAVVWDLRDGRAIRVIATPHVNVWAVALSRNGEKLASAGWDGTVRLWDARSGGALWSSKPDASTLRFSADGRRLIGGRLEQHRVWEVADGRLVWAGLEHGARHRRSAFAAVVMPDGRSSVEIVTTGWRTIRSGDVVDEIPIGHVAKVFDLDSGAAVRDLSGPEDHAGTLAVSAAGDRVALLTDKELLVVDRASGRRTATIPRAAEDWRATQAPTIVLADDPRFAAAWDGTQMIGWDLSTGKQLWRQPVAKGESIPQLAGGDTLFSVQSELCVGRRLSDGASLWRRPACAWGAVSASSPRILLARGTSGVDLVDAGSGKSMLPPPPAMSPTGAIVWLAISPDGTRVAGLAQDRSAWVWNAAGGGHRLVDAPDPLWYPVGRFLRDGRFAVLNRTDETDHGRIYRYDVDHDTIEAVADVAATKRLGLGAALVGERVILEEVRENDYLRTVVDLAGRLKPAHLPRWRRPSGRPADFNLRNESLGTAVIDRRLSRAYLAGNNSQVHAWDLRTGTLVAEAPAVPDFVAAMALTPDEKTLVVAYRKGFVGVYAASTLRELRRLEGPRREIRALAISPDGKLAVASAFNGLFAWRLTDGAKAATVDFSAADEEPWALAFAPDGGTLWVGTTLGNLHRFALRR